MNQPTRAEREKELRRMWKTKPGQYQVLRVYWKLQDTGALNEGDSVFEAILNHEYHANGTEP